MGRFDLGRFPPRVREKIERLSDIAGRIYSVPFLSRRLSFYGGTCLNFVHLGDPARLSLDLDFNFRESPGVDWGEERDKVDSHLKKILWDLGYADEDIRLQASYPLTRMEVWYEPASGGKDSLKLETGYQRRIPILSSDVHMTWHHPVSGRAIEVLTPTREELFSNKVATLLYRFAYPDHISGRDLFDVYTISNGGYERDPFMVSLVLDSLTRPERRLDEIPPELSIERVRVEGSVEELVFDAPPMKEMSEHASEYLKQFIYGLRNNMRLTNIDCGSR